jgi:hypothetical protein
VSVPYPRSTKCGGRSEATALGGDLALELGNPTAARDQRRGILGSELDEELECRRKVPLAEISGGENVRSAERAKSDHGVGVTERTLPSARGDELFEVALEIPDSARAVVLDPAGADSARAPLLVSPSLHSKKERGFFFTKERCVFGGLHAGYCG